MRRGHYFLGQLCLQCSPIPSIGDNLSARHFLLPNIDRQDLLVFHLVRVRTRWWILNLSRPSSALFPSVQVSYLSTHCVFFCIYLPYSASEYSIANLGNNPISCICEGSVETLAFNHIIFISLHDLKHRA